MTRGKKLDFFLWRNHRPEIFTRPGKSSVSAGRGTH